MVVSGQVNATTLVFEQGGNQQWLAAANFPNLLKKPSSGGVKATNPLVSIPIKQGDIEFPLWQGRPSTWTLVDKHTGKVLILVAIVTGSLFLRSQIPSEWEHLVTYITEGVIFLFLLFFLYHWIILKTTYWELTTEKITWKSGVFHRNVENLALYRIKDIRLYKPFLMRIIKHGKVDFITSDV